MEQIDFFGVFSGCDNMGDDGYLNDMPLIWGIFVAFFLVPEKYNRVRFRDNDRISYPCDVATFDERT